MVDRADRNLPVGTVTLLMADVEGSVRRWEAGTDAASAAFARLDDIVTDRARVHRGGRPLEQGEGDSFVVTFSRPSDAVACALDLQTSFAAESWPGGLALRVRMALHTGEVELREDGRYAGHAFNRGGRLRALAHGGQTLVSRTTQDLVADALPEGATFRDLGEHGLRDLGRPERVFQLCHPLLPDDFPSLRSLSALPNNLPQQLTSFVGRESELAEVRAKLGDSRMLTLTGAGGSGKTRLAVHAAALLLDAFTDGAWWVDLAPVTEATLVAGAVAAVVAPVHGEGDPRLALVESIAAQQMLIVLDNCEHLVEECAALASLVLQRCPGVRILATSREPLGVEGEVVFRVPSLAVPDGADGEPSSLSTVAAVRLFVERATQVRPNFRLTAENAAAVGTICARLDGIPLAIELAAARARVLSPAQIAEGLTDRFRILTGGARNVMPRQRTMEASVEWSYQLLLRQEQCLLNRLSVFAGTFDLDAAEDIGASDPIDRYAVLDLLTGLLDKSLIQIEGDATEARYRLLETIAVYARSKLVESGEAAEVRARHYEHYRAFAERVAPLVQGRDVGIWWPRLKLELGDLRAAMAHAPTGEDLLRIATALSGVWWALGGLPLLREIVAEVRSALASEWTDPALRARALLLLAAQDLTQRSLVDEALALAREANDEVVSARALAMLGQGEFWVGSGRLESLDDAVEAARATGSRPAIVSALTARAMAASALGGYFAGWPDTEEVIAIARAAGDPRALWAACAGAAWWPAMEGHLTVAEDLIGTMRQIADQLESPTLRSQVFLLDALLHLERGEYQEALTRVAAAESLERAPDGRGTRIRISSLISMGALDQGRELAERHLDELREANPEALQWVTSNVLWQIAWAAIAMGDLAVARARLDESIARARAGPMVFNLARGLHYSARLARLEGDSERAQDLAHEALRLLVAAGDRQATPDVLEALAGLAVDAERPLEAARLFGAAQRSRADTGVARPPVDQPGYEQDVAAVRVMLEEAAFEAAWSEGAELSLDAAAAYAARGRGERGRPSTGWASLTPAELEVVRLVAAGHSNPEIAERLFIARNTVKVHLSHVFGKLGIATRAALAAEAVRRGI